MLFWHFKSRTRDGSILEPYPFAGKWVLHQTKIRTGLEGGGSNVAKPRSSLGNGLMWRHVFRNSAIFKTAILKTAIFLTAIFLATKVDKIVGLAVPWHRHNQLIVVLFSIVFVHYWNTTLAASGLVARNCSTMFASKGKGLCGN